MDKSLVFFGCNCQQKGHYFYENDGYRLREIDVQHLFDLRHPVFATIDGVFAPFNTRKAGIYQINSVPPLLIVSWWDYTGDERPGSNSSLIGRGFKDAEEMIDDAIKQFPKIMGRQSRPLPVTQSTTTP